MAYSAYLMRKGIKQKDSRLMAKGAEDASISSFGGMLSITEAVAFYTATGTYP
jgi:hypothetical protein